MALSESESNSKLGVLLYASCVFQLEISDVNYFGGGSVLDQKLT